MNEYIDLHSHTRYSDGTSTVENSLTQAEKLGLSIFSVSDHGTVLAYPEIMEKRHLFSGRILPAVEIGATYKGEAIEILGYGFDVSAMDKMLKETAIADRSAKEVLQTLDSLLSSGVRLDEAFVAKVRENPKSYFRCNIGGIRFLILEEMRKFPENARFFESDKHFIEINRHRFTRDYLFNPKSELFVDQTPLHLSMEQVLDLIHQAGGLAFLAHTYVYSPNIAASLDDIVTHPFDGLETHYGTYTKEQKEYLSNFCRKKGLYQSGGSDFHGLDMRPENPMGLSAGGRIEISLVEPWLGKVEKSLL